MNPPLFIGGGGGQSMHSFRFVPVLAMTVYEDYCAVVVMKVSKQGL
jgi:hypothetical protein